jgi:hypothetical protein
MSAHKHKEGVIVDIGGGALSVIPPGRYEIIRRMPPTVAGDNQYRVKSLRDGHERLVRESDLTEAAAGNGAAR